MRIKVLLLAAGAALALVASPTAAWAGGAQHACQHGGYRDLVGTNGPFTSNGQCVRYAVHHGVLYPKHPTLTGTVTREGNVSTVVYTGSGWVPGSVETGTLHTATGPYPGYVDLPETATADSGGNLAGGVDFDCYLDWYFSLANSYGQSAIYGASASDPTGFQHCP